MFELPTFGQVVQLLFLIALIYWAFKAIYEASEEKKQHDKEEKALIQDAMFLTITRAQVERHLLMLLDKVASYKLHYVIITDEKEIPQSVLLPYAEYKILQECYDKQEAIELAPLIKERMQNHTNQDNSISHEEMMHRIDKKRAKRQEDEHPCQKAVLQASQDEAYTKEFKDIE